MAQFPGGVAPPPDYVPAAVFRQLTSVVNAQAAQLSLLSNELKGAAETVRQLKDGAANKLAPKYIEDIPGKRSVYWNVVKIDFDSAISNGLRKSGSITISQDGPFVWTDTTMFWQVTTLSAGGGGGGTDDADIQRVFVPPSRMPFLISAAAANAAPGAAIQPSYLDFLITFKQGGSDRMLNSTNEIPAAALFRNDRPSYNGISHWFERNETLTIEATAQITATAANAPDSAARGTLWAVLSGYKILRAVDFAEVFGF